MPDSDKPAGGFFDCAQNDREDARNDSSIVTLSTRLKERRAAKHLPGPDSDKPVERFFASLRMTKRALGMTAVLSP